MIWGFAGVWPADYGIWEAEDQWMAKLEFVVRHGFRSTDFPLEQMREPARRDQVASFVAEHDLRLTVGVGPNWFGDEPGAATRTIDEFLHDLESYGGLLRTPFVRVGGGGLHRFMERPCLEEQLDRLAESFPPLTSACRDLGYRCCIENHGDYYCSDLVALCQRVPNLHIFLDTGNTYLIGEKPIPAAREAAPYTIGTHFKDHCVHPVLSPLRFEIEGATLGEGHVGLREIYEILLESAPSPEELIMQWELVPPKDMNALESLRQSWEFVRSLRHE